MGARAQKEESGRTFSTLELEFHDFVVPNPPIESYLILTSDVNLEYVLSDCPSMQTFGHTEYKQGRHLHGQIEYDMSKDLVV